MLVGFCLFFASHSSFNLYIYNDRDGKGSNFQYWISNLLATIENIFLLLYDWLFVEQYLSAALMLPIALEGGKNEKELSTMKRRVKLFLNIISGGFYLVIVVYAIASIATGDIFIRFQNSIIEALVIVIFILSLCKIQSQLGKIGQNHGRQTEHVNKVLLHCYMIMFICELVLLIAIMLFFYYVADDHHQIRQVSQKESRE